MSVHTATGADLDRLLAAAEIPARSDGESDFDVRGRLVAARNKAMANPDCHMCKGEGFTGHPMGRTTMRFACACVETAARKRKSQARAEIASIAHDLVHASSSYARRQGARLAKALEALS